MTTKMTFDEWYGPLPVKTLRLIRKFNVSPADFDDMLDRFMYPDEGKTLWDMIDEHIVSNSETGMYRPMFF